MPSDLVTVDRLTGFVWWKSGTVTTVETVYGHFQAPRTARGVEELW